MEELVAPETNTFVFKALNGLAPQNLAELFLRKSHSSVHNFFNTTYDNTLSRKKTDTGQKFVSFRGV